MTPHRHYTYFWRRCRECGRPAIDASEYCEECRDQIDREEAEAREQEAEDADSVPEAFPCTCTRRYAPWGSPEPPEPILNRYCPQHGDGGPDPDAAREARLESIMNAKRDILDNGD